MPSLNRSINRSVDLSRAVSHVLERRIREAREHYVDRVRSATERARKVPATPLTPLEAVRQWQDYTVDCAQRAVLFWDTLRQRGNNWIEHEAAGKPPVLAYDYEVLADARRFERPANYALVRIVPPKGVRIDEASRPYVIIDPRAGHGPGIGGFRIPRSASHCAPDTRCTSSSSIPIRCPARPWPTCATPKPSSSASSPSGTRGRRARSSSATARAAGR